MSSMASQITSLAIVYATVYSGANQRKCVEFTGDRPVTRKMFPFDDIILIVAEVVNYI